MKDLLINATLGKNAKSKQLECIMNVLKGNDTLAILPTGYGKSFIYQVLPLICRKLSFLGFSFTKNPIVIVISPLVALINDQVHSCNSLTNLGLRASSLDTANYYDIAKGKFNVLYGTPESWLQNKKWKDLLSMEIFVKIMVCLVIDEVHKVPSW